MNKKLVQPTPIYEQLYRLLKKDIIGKYRPGDQLPSTRQLEADFKVSRKTISKVIALLVNDGLVFREQGKKMFVTKKPFRTLLARSGNIGLVFDCSGSVAHPFMAPAVSTIINAINQYGQGIKFITLSESPGEKPLGLGKVMNQLEDIHGLIFTTSQIIRKDLLALSRRGLPFVMMSHYYNRDLDMVRVYGDENRATREATEYLLNSGHTKIALLYGKKEWPADQDRLAVFESVLKERNLSGNSQWMKESFYEMEKTYKAVEEIMSLSVPPTTILCADDMVASWVIEKLSLLGKKVPQDISVVGGNDMEMYSLRPPGLTTFRRPYAEIGQAAVRTLMTMIRGKPPNFKEQKFHYTLIERNTCRKLA